MGWTMCLKKAIPRMTPKRALTLLARFPRYRVAVVGDLMLDRYLTGSASRISPEAPVPVVRVRDSWATLGGAANVATNLATLGAQPLAFGIVGDDPAGAEVLALCQAKGIDPRGVLRLKERKTTVKTRLIANHQQVARIDDEDDTALAPTVGRRLLAALRAAATAGQLDAIIFEDYHKGLLTRTLTRQMLAVATASQLPTALDPHPGNPMNLTGFTLMTPNRAEAFALAGAYLKPTVVPLTQDRPLLEVGRRLSRKWRTTHLLVTLGADGMALFGGAGPPLHVPTVAKEVYDVSGAGDTVIATFMLALLAGATAPEAAVISNNAAGIVVGKVGTAPVELAELRACFGG